MTVVAGRYELVRLIGEGGMGEVHEAINRETGRRVALKRLRSQNRMESEVATRFAREILATAKIGSRHVVAIHDAGVDDDTGAPFFVMDLLAGEDLGRLADRLGMLPVDLAVRLAAQACEGLIAAHAAGIVHRDIKPANLFLVAPTASGRIVKLVDFGIARIRTGGVADAVTEMTQTGAILGSPLYMAPEQLRGDKALDHRADVWSLGVVLYRLLCGAVPHTGATVADILVKVCSEPAPPIRDRAPWVPAELADVVHRALAIDPAERIPTARAFADALAPWLRDGTAITDAMLVAQSRVEPPPAPRTVKGLTAVATETSPRVTIAPAPRPPIRTSIGVLAIFAVIAAVAVAYRGRQGPDPEAPEPPPPTRLPKPPPPPPPAEPPAIPPDLHPALLHSTAATWFASVRPHCTARELDTVLTTTPPPNTQEGVAFAAGCAMLGGAVERARAMIDALVDPAARAYAIGPTFELAYELAERNNHDRYLAEVMRFVIDEWPANSYANYVAGLAELQLGDPRAAAHLRAFLQRARRADPRVKTATDCLAVLEAPRRDCTRALADPYGNPISIPGC